MLLKLQKSLTVKSQRYNSETATNEHDEMKPKECYKSLEEIQKTIDGMRLI